MLVGQQGAEQLLLLWRLLQALLALSAGLSVELDTAPPSSSSGNPDDTV